MAMTIVGWDGRALAICALVLSGRRYRLINVDRLIMRIPAVMNTLFGNVQTLWVLKKVLGVIRNGSPEWRNAWEHHSRQKFTKGNKSNTSLSTPSSEWQASDAWRWEADMPVCLRAFRVGGTYIIESEEDSSSLEHDDDLTSLCLYSPIGVTQTRNY